MANLQYSSFDHFLKDQVIDKKLDPTVDEIEFAIHQIRLRFSNLQPFTLIKILYQKMIRLKDKQNTQIPYSNMSSQLRKYPQMTTLIIKSFYYMGYGYHKFKTFMKAQCLPFSINKYAYTKICEDMVIHIYRSLERLLTLNHLEYRYRQDIEVKELNLWILNYHCNLNQKAKSNLLKFIAQLYGIEKTSFSFQEARQLYSFLQKRFKQQQITYIQTQNYRNSKESIQSHGKLLQNKTSLYSKRLKVQQQECTKKNYKLKNQTIFGNDSFDEIGLQQFQMENNSNIFFDENSLQQEDKFHSSPYERDSNEDHDFLKDVPSSLSNYS